MTRIDRDTVNVLHNCGPSVSNVYRTGAVGAERIVSPSKLAMHLFALADITDIADITFCQTNDTQLHPVIVEAAACALLSRIGSVIGRDIATNLAELVPMVRAGRKALGSVSRRVTERACERVTEVRDLLPALGEGKSFCGVVKWSYPTVAPNFAVGDGTPAAKLADVRQAAVLLTLIAYATPPIVLLSREASLQYFQRTGALTTRSFGPGGAA